MFLYLNATSETEESKYNYYRDMKATVGDVRDEILDKKDTLDQYFTVRKGIVNMLAENDEDKRDNFVNITDLEY